MKEKKNKNHIKGDQLICKIFTPPFQEKVMKRLEILVQEHSNENQERQRITYQRIYPLIGAVQVKMEEGLSKEEAIKEVQEAFYENYVYPSLKSLKRFFSIPLLYKFFIPLSIKLVRKRLKVEIGFLYNISQEEKNESRYDIIKCPYHEICCDYGLPEMTDIFCTSDDIIYTSVHNNIVFERSKTIGRGDDICDFHFYRKDVY
ncbi:MAG: L-2-amino-thiazoline-4-carboxylic acid hydrolase [Tissierellia bacterium]|nr:L-2-amino-thiazoline-4-carboxylic acid hydrolase [Tissierellia bacterium]